MEWPTGGSSVCGVVRVTRNITLGFDVHVRYALPPYQGWGRLVVGHTTLIPVSLFQTDHRGGRTAVARRFTYVTFGQLLKNVRVASSKLKVTLMCCEASNTKLPLLKREGFVTVLRTYGCPAAH